MEYDYEQLDGYVAAKSKNPTHYIAASRFSKQRYFQIGSTPSCNLANRTTAASKQRFAFFNAANHTRTAK